MDGWIWKLEREPFHIPLSPEQEQHYGIIAEQCQKVGQRFEKECDEELWAEYRKLLAEVEEWNEHVAFRDGFHLAAEFFLEILCNRL